MSKTFAVSDLHGRYDLWEQIKEFLQEDDTLYVIGDCADRGKDGWKIIQEVYADPRCIYIKGNHEELFIAAMEGDRLLHDYNGGAKTYKHWKYVGGGDRSWIRKLKELPVHVTYVNAQGQTVELTHAGYTPGFYEGDELPNDYDLVWDRAHLLDDWREGYDDVIIVHGHTPIPYMNHYLSVAIMNEQELESFLQPGVFWYSRSASDGKCHKVDIDCGAFFSGHTALLDLDTWEQHIFKGKDYEEGAIWD